MIKSNEFENLWIEKYRPKSFNDLILSPEDKSYFKSLIEKKEIPHLLFTGPAGIGKTSLAKIIVADILDCQYLYINASDENGIDTIRNKINGFAQTKSFDGKLKVVLLDEADSLSNPAQDALRNVIEEYSSNTRFVFTCNYLHKISSPIQSRCKPIISLNPPLKEICARVLYILKEEGVEIPQSEFTKLMKLIKDASPDIRSIIGMIQQYSHSGILSIKNNKAKSIAEEIVKKIEDRDDLTSIRKYIIERELEFSADYTSLLKEIFESYYTLKEQNESIKSAKLLEISEAMYRDSIVIDKEINCFSCIIKLNNING